MSWINPDSGRLINAPEAISFARKNNLEMIGSSEGSYFANSDILIHIYEERTYLHADYFDLKNSRWQRELQTEIVELEIPEIEERKGLIATFESSDRFLSAKSMQQFRFILYVIDKFMQDFLLADFTRYEGLFQPLNDRHRDQIEKLARSMSKSQHSTSGTQVVKFKIMKDIFMTFAYGLFKKGNKPGD